MCGGMKLHIFLSTLMVASATGGCTFGDGDDDPVARQAEHLETYDSLHRSLLGRATVFVEGAAQDFTVAGNHLFWIDAAAGNPILRSYNDDTGAKTRYGFAPYLIVATAPNPIDNVNFRVSPSTVAVMNEPDGANLYRVDAEEEHLDKLTLPAPPYGQKWWSYAVDGDIVFTAVLRDEELVVQSFRAGDEQPTVVASLTELIAPEVIGEFFGFAISGSTLIFNESGRIWMADLGGGGSARWAKNDMRVGGVHFDGLGAVYNQDERFYRYDFVSDTREDLTERMLAGYEMNETFAAAHHPTPSTTWFKYQSRIAYVANSGLFTFDMTSGSVAPLLLDARDNSIVFRNPAVLDNGTLFVKGLQSSSGSTGADGPTYRVGL